MSTTVAIKIDVDTYIGTRQGIPRLLDIFRKHGVKATFFAVLGPDNSGKAIRRVFTRKGFVGKMARTNPLKIYGLKTLLYGTLLPAPMTGLAHPEILERIVAEEIVPATRRYRDFLADEYRAVSREEVGVTANPDGAACYEASVRFHTTLPLTAEEIHAVRNLSPVVTRALRHAVGRADTGRAGGGPAMLVVDADGGIESMTADAEAILDDLRTHGLDRLPI